MAAKEAGVIAFKLYPAGATTNSDSGVTDWKKCLATLQTMDKVSIIFLVNAVSLNICPFVLGVLPIPNNRSIKINKNKKCLYFVSVLLFI
jgi:hypothetical protein